MPAVSDQTEQTPPMLQLGGKDIYNEDAEDTNDHGGKKDESFLERLGVAFRSFPSFCPRDHPEPVKSQVGEIGPAATSLTFVAYAMGHASCLLGGAVSGILGLGVFQAISVMDDTYTRLGRIEELLKDRVERQKNTFRELDVFFDEQLDKCNDEPDRETVDLLEELQTQFTELLRARRRQQDS